MKNVRLQSIGSEKKFLNKHYYCPTIQLSKGEKPNAE